MEATGCLSQHTQRPAGPGIRDAHPSYCFGDLPAFWQRYSWPCDQPAPLPGLPGGGELWPCRCFGLARHLCPTEDAGFIPFMCSLLATAFLWFPPGPGRSSIMAHLLPPRATCPACCGILLVRLPQPLPECPAASYSEFQLPAVWFHPGSTVDPPWIHTGPIPWGLPSFPFSSHTHSTPVTCSPVSHERPGAPCPPLSRAS